MYVCQRLTSFVISSVSTSRSSLLVGGVDIINLSATFKYLRCHPRGYSPRLCVLHLRHPFFKPHHHTRGSPPSARLKSIAHTSLMSIRPHPSHSLVIITSQQALLLIERHGSHVHARCFFEVRLGLAFSYDRTLYRLTSTSTCIVSSVGRAEILQL